MNDPAPYTAHAVLYGTRAGSRHDNLLHPTGSDAPMPLAYYVWVLRRDDQVVLVDTGFSAATARRRGLTALRDPITALAALEVRPADVDEVIVTHCHDDHIGNVDRLPGARVHLQEAEMAFATGRFMASDACGSTVALDDVQVLVRRAFAGTVAFHDGDAELAPGLSVHLLGGHTAGLQCVRVWTAQGWLVLASDATHFYDNLTERSPYRQVLDVGDALRGFDRLRALAGGDDRVVPGHDPAVMDRFPRLPGAADAVVRLA